jgi:phosphate transport system permease protein
VKKGRAQGLLQRNNEAVARFVFLAAACVCVLCVALICAYLFATALPALAKIGPLQFLGGVRWDPNRNIFGILPMLVGSVCVTGGAILFGVPVGLLTAVYLAKFAGSRTAGVLRPLVSLMAGLPSIVYGFFGLVVLVPLLRELLGGPGRGKSILTASILLGMMILPTIIGVSESALRAVPGSYHEGALALGASHERSTFFVVLPAAKSGILASIVLGVGRAVGETMAVVMVAGNQARLPGGVLEGVRTMTANIVLEMGYAQDLHREALIATATALFVFILLINLLLARVKRGDRA